MRNMSYFNNSNAFIMVEPTDFDICHGIQEAIKNKDSWKQYSIAAKELYKCTFNWSSAVSQLIASYELILNR